VSEPAVFVGFVEDNEDCTFAFDFPDQYHAYKKHFRGCEVEVEIRERGHSKTRAQEKGFHAMIAPWWKSRGIDIAALKRYILGRLWGYRDELCPFTGERLLVEPRTSGLSKRKYSELIEATLVYAAEDQHVLVAPDEYRAMHPEKYPVKREKKRRAA
jgi:hypothetical protein